ncbi:carbonic anhydrase [Streptomyces xanthophaeus]|uniref:carbonic anhydrase n=1 Tax=Streptomyces xanthophaeus TaxID=67385 RepID=UPI00099DB70E
MTSTRIYGARRREHGRPTGAGPFLSTPHRSRKVRDIIVCGHSHCGAVGAVARGEDLTHLPSVADWVDFARRRRSHMDVPRARASRVPTPPASHGARDAGPPAGGCASAFRQSGAA